MYNVLAAVACETWQCYEPSMQRNGSITVILTKVTGNFTEKLYYLNRRHVSGYG